MSTQFSNYLGDWICNDPKDPERCEVMKCVRVDEKTRMAIFESGKQISTIQMVCTKRCIPSIMHLRLRNNLVR